MKDGMIDLNWNDCVPPYTAWGGEYHFAVICLALVVLLTTFVMKVRRMKTLRLGCFVIVFVHIPLLFSREFTYGAGTDNWFVVNSMNRLWKTAARASGRWSGENGGIDPQNDSGGVHIQQVSAGRWRSCGCDKICWTFDDIVLDSGKQVFELGSQNVSLDQAYGIWANFALINVYCSLKSGKFESLPDKLEDIRNVSYYVDKDPWGLADTRLQDPWRRPIDYRKISDQKFELRSAGVDGVLRTDDDVVIDSAKPGAGYSCFFGNFSP